VTTQIERMRARLEQMEENIARNEAIGDAYVGGESVASIAARYGISHQRVYQVLAANGHSRSGPCPRCGWKRGDPIEDGS
jgi:hypothetical protein